MKIRIFTGAKRVNGVLLSGLCALCFLLFNSPVYAGQFACQWNSADFAGVPLSNKFVFITPIAPYGVDGSTLINRDRRRYTNDSSGSLIVSNMFNGRSYRVEFTGRFEDMVITNSFATNVTGLVNGALYLPAEIRDGSTLAYSQTAADGRFLQRSNGSGARVTLADTNTFDAISLGGEARISWPRSGIATLEGSGTNTLLYDNGGILSGDFDNRVLRDTAARLAASWTQRNLLDAAEAVSVDWAARQLYGGTGAMTLDWGNKTFGAGWTFSGDGIVTSTTVTNIAAAFSFENAAFPFLVHQGFEGTNGAGGYDNRETWYQFNYANAVIDPAYTGTVLSGAHSLRINITNSGAFFFPSTLTEFTPCDDVLISFLLRPVRFATSKTYVADLLNGNFIDGHGSRLTVTIDATRHLAFEGFASGATVGVLTTNVTYKVWIHKRREGAVSIPQSMSTNGLSSVAFSTNGIRPISGDNYAEARDPGTIRVSSLNLPYGNGLVDQELIYDDIRVAGDGNGATDAALANKVDIGGDGSALTVDASGFSGNLTTDDDTLQEIANKVDLLSFDPLGAAAAATNALASALAQTNSSLASVTNAGTAAYSNASAFLLSYQTNQPLSQITNAGTAAYSNSSAFALSGGTVADAQLSTNVFHGSLFIIPGFTTGENKLRMFWSGGSLSNVFPICYAPVFDPGALNASRDLRDPFIWFTNNLYYVAYTIDGLTRTNRGFGIAYSDDLINWNTNVIFAPVNVTNTYPSQAMTWGPVRFIDPADSVEHFFVTVATNNTTTQLIYELHPTGANYSTWSTPVQVTGTFASSNKICEAVTWADGSYRMLVKDDPSLAGGYNDMYVSGSLTSGWVAFGTGDWAGWGTGIEGGALTWLGGNSWRVLFDRYNLSGNGLATSVSTNNMTNWSALTIVAGSQNGFNGSLPQNVQISNPAGIMLAKQVKNISDVVYAQRLGLWLTNQNFVTASLPQLQQVPLTNSGYLGLGTASPAGALHIVAQGGGAGAGFVYQEWESASTWTGLIMRRARGTTASKTIVSSGDVAGFWDGQAWDGAAWRDLGFAQWVVDATPGSGDMPGRFEIWTTTDGTTTQTRRMVIDNAGTVTVGGPLAATNGFASFAAVASVAIDPTGWTNIWSTNNASVVFGGTAVSAFKKRAGALTATNITYPVFTGNQTVHLQPGQAVVISGTAVTGTADPE